MGSTIPDWMPLFYYCSRRKCDETYSESTFPKTWIQKCKTFLNVALPNWSIIDYGLVGPWTVWPDLCKIPPLWRNNLKSLQFIWGLGQSFQLTIGHIFIAESGQILKRQFGHLVTLFPGVVSIRVMHRFGAKSWSKNWCERLRDRFESRLRRRQFPRFRSLVSVSRKIKWETSYDGSRISEMFQRRRIQLEKHQRVHLDLD